MKKARKIKAKQQPFLKTIGHGSHTLPTFLAKLYGSGVDHIIDVRSFPRSFRHPHFSQLPLQEALAREGIKYTFYGNRLGGRGANWGYDDAINELAQMAKRGEHIALLCSESLATTCHRSKKLQPSLEALGVEVRHITYDKDER